MGGRSRFSCVVVAMAVGLPASSCGGGPAAGGVPTGSALRMPYGTMTKDTVPFSVGQRWDHTLLAIINGSKSPVTVVRVQPTHGSGLGTIVKAVGYKDAPMTLTGQTPSLNTVPEAVYHTLPPVFYSAGGVCRVQRLKSLAGTILRPGQETRVLTVLRGVAPGNARYEGYDVYYRQAGTLYRQYIPIGYAATVMAGRPSPLQEWENRRCLAKTSVLPPLGG